MSEPFHRGARTLRRLALVCVALLLATISLSAYMRLSQAGIGCAAGPACYGAQLQELRLGMQAHARHDTGVELARLLHRVVASLALVLVVAMVVLARSARPAIRGSRGLTNALLALALALAVLGVATPGARLPAVAMGNLLGGFAMLALCWRLVGRTRADAAQPPAALGAWGVAALALLVAQLAGGALVSASYAALSCTDLADCQRNAQASGWDWRVLNPWHEPVFDPSLPPVNPAGALAQWLHRLGAIVMAPVLALLAATAWQRGRRQAGAALLALTLLQVALGLAMVAVGLPLALVLLHNLVGALLLATLVRLV